MARPGKTFIEKRKQGRVTSLPNLYTLEKTSTQKSKEPRRGRNCGETPSYAISGHASHWSSTVRSTNITFSGRKKLGFQLFNIIDLLSLQVLCVLLIAKSLKVCFYLFTTWVQWKKKFKQRNLPTKDFADTQLETLMKPGAPVSLFCPWSTKQRRRLTWHQFHQWKQSFSLVRCIRFTSAQRLWCSCSQSGPALHNAGFCNRKKPWAFCVPENVQPKSGVSSAVGFKPNYGDMQSNMGSDGDLPAKWPI